MGSNPLLPIRLKSYMGWNNSLPIKLNYDIWVQTMNLLPIYLQLHSQGTNGNNGFC